MGRAELEIDIDGGPCARAGRHASTKCLTRSVLKAPALLCRLSGPLRVLFVYKSAHICMHRHTEGLQRAKDPWESRSRSRAPPSRPMYYPALRLWRKSVNVRNALWRG
jgi:hypothetical protein